MRRSKQASMERLAWSAPCRRGSTLASSSVPRAGSAAPGAAGASERRRRARRRDLMTAERLAELEERVAALERPARRWHAAARLGAAALLAGVLLGPALALQPAPKPPAP